MSKNQLKHIKVSEDVHTDLKVVSAKLKKEMQQVADDILKAELKKLLTALED